MPSLADLLGKGGDEPDGDEGGSDYGGALEDAMSAFIGAVKSGDAKGAAQAFSDAHAICQKDGGGDDDSGSGGHPALLLTGKKR
jgi:hypothetical protein